MKLDICIPSLNRRQKLDNCLNSIFLSSQGLQDIDIYLYLSSNEDYQHYWSYFNEFKNVHVVLLESYRVPNLWNNHLRQMQADALVCFNDDLIIYRDTLSKLIKNYTRLFPSNNGIMGLNQINIPNNQALDCAFPVIGKEYAKLFPDSQVWCPDYDRMWCDKELGDFAKSVGRFSYAEEVWINHLHPAYGGEADETHYKVRKYIPKDKITYYQRKDKGWIWGKDFNLLHGESNGQH